MIFQVRLLEGIFRPSKHFTYFANASTIRGFQSRFFLILIFYFVLAALSGYLGIGMEELMSKMDSVSEEKLEWAKVLFGLGEILKSILFPLWFMFLFSTALTFYVQELSYYKLWLLQIYPVTIFFLEKLVNTFIYLFLGIPFELNVFSLGPIFQLLTDDPLFLTLASKTTLFQLWAAIVQLISLKTSTEESYLKLIPIILLLYILFNSISAITSVVIQDVGIIL